MIALIESDTIAGVRDRALVLLGFAAALRRSELVALDAEDLRFDAVRGLLVTIRRSKTDQQGQGELVAVTYAQEPDRCAVRSVRHYLDATGIDRGGRRRGTPDREWRHRSLPVLRGYIRAATAFDDVGDVLMSFAALLCSSRVGTTRPGQTAGLGPEAAAWTKVALRQSGSVERPASGNQQLPPTLSELLCKH